MIAHALEEMRSLGVRPDAKSLALVDVTVALRRCALYRNAFMGTAISYPAAFFGFDALTAWILRNRVTVDVTTAGELERTIAAGIDPMRVVMHPGTGAAAAIRRAVGAGAARFVVSSTQQIAILADSADRIQQVVIDPTDVAVDTLASEVVAHRGLDLIGLHSTVDDDDPIGAAKLRRMVADMWRIRREHRILLTRISLTGLDVGERGLEPRILRRVAEAIGEVVREACAQYRFPGPSLTLAPRRSALVPPVPGQGCRVGR